MKIVVIGAPGTIGRAIVAELGAGHDIVEVGKSRGDGGLGIWSGGNLFVSSNYRSAHIITTGPIRSEFELIYDAWDAGGRKVSETKRISIDAGSNMCRAESMFESDDQSPLEIGVGIAERPGDGGLLTQNQNRGWQTYWQPVDRDRGNIACAIILPDGVKQFTTEKTSLTTPSAAHLAKPGAEGMPPIANQLAIAQVKVGKSFVYYFGASWSKSGDFPDPESWNQYVSHFAECLAAPLQVTVGN